MNVEHIYAPADWDGGGLLLAILSRAEDGEQVEGIEFLTTPEAPMQMAIMSYPAGKVVSPHVHLSVPRVVERSQEALFVRRGKVLVRLYRPDKVFVTERELGPGDVILLVAGGHGIEVLEDAEIVEVKQGPYPGDALDKERFSDERQG